MATTWTPKMLARLQELAEERSQHGSPSARQIAELLSEEFDTSLTKDIVNHTINDKLNPQAYSVEPVVYLPMFEKYQKLMVDPPAKVLKQNLLTGYKKVLHICDLHIPFQNTEAVAHTLRANASVDIVVASELMDLSSQSSWDKLKPPPIELEIEETLRYLELLNDTFETTFIIMANHDLRVQRRITRNLPVDLQNLVDSFSLIEFLVRPFPNIHLVNNWWFILGDALFCHASKAIATNMRTVDELDSYFKKHGEAIGRAYAYRVLVQAHTHRLGVIYGPNLKMFEGGMLCNLPDWYLEKPVKIPWSTGYIRLEMQDGVCILDRCREHVIPSKLGTSLDTICQVGKV